jgi:hypothetical protein
VIRTVAVALALALVACKGGDGEYSGIGHWRFGTTTRKDVGAGTCFATKLGDGRDATRCMGLQQLKVGERNADVEVYFLGDQPDAPLIEIMLTIRGCNEDDVDRFMRRTFGDPFQTRANRAYWKNSFMWMAALLPSESARCAVHFLPNSETAEIARIEKL